MFNASDVRKIHRLIVKKPRLGASILAVIDSMENAKDDKYKKLPRQLVEAAAREIAGLELSNDDMTQEAISITIELESE